MLTGKKFVLAAAASFVLLFWTTAIAAQSQTETSVVAVVHYTLLKSIDYEMARKLFQIIYQDKILKVQNPN